MAKYVVENYHYDACPSKVQGCSIDQLYAMSFHGCPNMGVFSRAQDCFVGRITAMAKRMHRGLHNDPDHFHPIRVAGYYLTMCLARENSYADAEHYVTDMMDGIFAEHGVHRPHGLLPFIPGNPAQTDSCKEGMKRAIAGLDDELDLYMHGGGDDKALNRLTGRYIKRNGKTARKLGIN